MPELNQGANIMRARYIMIITIVVACTSTSAAPCAAQKAAERGSKTGYERDKTAAEEMEKKASESSDVLAKCIKGITTVTVVPTFPSLSDIFAGAMEKVCKVSIDKVRAGLPPGMSGVPARPGDLIRPVPGIPGVPTVPTGVPSRSGGAPTETASKSAEFWKRIWR
ncbi:MAG: hypothetical protein K2X55_16160 [Burkholderiaceae bacterium]|nr:hypothetical protein [Burkholderiaceae bacterium]